MKALVIGGNGFIGTNLVDELLSAFDSVHLEFSCECEEQTQFARAAAEIDEFVARFGDAFDDASDARGAPLRIRQAFEFLWENLIEFVVVNMIARDKGLDDIGSELH